MKVFIKQIDIIERLIKDKKYHDALAHLDGIDIDAFSNEELAKYNLVYSEAMIRMGNYEIEKNLQHAMEFYKFSHDTTGFARSKFLYGLLLISKGKNIEAREILVESYVSYKRTDNLNGCSNVLNRLAFLDFQLGNIESAISALEKCVDYQRSLNNKDSIILLKRNIASILFMSGKLMDSIKVHAELRQEIVSLAENYQIHFYLTYAMATALQGDIEKAFQLISKTTEFPDDYKREKAQYYEYLGWIYNLDERYDKAVETLKTGIELSMEIAPESALISQSKRLLADAYVSLGKFDLAEKTAKETLIVAEKINERVEIAACYRVFARVDQHRGNKEKSKEWFGKAIDLFAMIKSRYEMAVTRYLAAQSKFYDDGERAAMLYLAKQYFKSEDVGHYVEKIEEALVPKPLIRIKHNPRDKNHSEFIAADPKMKKIVDMAENVAQSDMTILLTGPTGSGKDQLAKYIHYCSGRKGEFVTVNSAAIPDSMVESELFGFRKGAFTGAGHDRTGLIKRSSGGTLYLNEIADATLEFQAKLLEVIETKSVRHLGGDDQMNIDLRIISATNHNLRQRIDDGKFRLDLYHRLNVVPIDLPPLRKRPEDIPVLIRHFLDTNGFDIGNNGSRDQLDLLCQYMSSHDWTGNVRELKSEVDRLCFLSERNIEKMLDLAKADSLDEKEKLLAALEKSGGSRRKAATILGITEGGVRYRMIKYGIDHDETA